MSLNGLDDLKIKEAHDTAAAEPGGWFLLKYAARDEIELLGRGNGGIVEIRNAIAQYEEPAAPLFGFLRYRRRNVVIKYVPEECSRLVQARVTVHFNAVTERFSPHDTVFPIVSSKELRDTTLSAACSLHTASGSTSSSTSSLRRRRLMEIAEDAEEDQRAKRQSTVPEERPPTAKTPSVSGGPPSLPPTSPPPELPFGLPPSTSYQSTVTDAETVSSATKDLLTTEFRSRSPTRSVAEPRKSSQSTRPDFHSYASYGSNGKPKIKLGPRPSLDVGGRPHTSSASSFYRPVSTLPAGLKLFSKGSRKGKERPQSQYPSEPPSMTLSPPPVPEGMLSPASPGPVRPHTSGGRPLSSKPLMSPTIPVPKTPSITPEKARLMKAMELRKKKNAAPPASPGLPPPSNALASPTTPSKSSSSEAPISDTLAMLDDLSKGDDSGIAFDASSTLKTDESDATRSDSYPVSPVGPSEQAESTRASSISESTDETIQEPNNLKQTTPDENTSEDQAPIPGAGQESNKFSMSAAENKDVEASTSASTLMPVPVDGPQVLPDSPDAALGHTEVTKSEVVVKEALDNPDFVAQPILQEVNEVTLSLLPDIKTSTSTVQVIPAELKEESAPTTEKVDTALTSDNMESPLSTSAILSNTSEQETAPEPEVSVQPASPESQLKEWKIPRSKFSVQDLKAAAMVPEAPKEPLPTISQPSIAPKSPVQSTFSADPSFTEEDDEHENTSKRKRRRGLVEPIRTDIDIPDRSGANSEANFSSDDELMDELQSAVFQEAKPISVSKSPISPVFPSPKKQSGQPGRFSRAFSSPFRKENSDSKHLETPTPMQPTQKPTQKPTRSVSAAAAYLDQINKQSTQPLAKKVNLGSGISQRIKALEKLGAGANTPPSTIGPTPAASTSFFSVRKASVRAPSRSPSIAERASSLTRGEASPSISRESSPETLKIRDRSGSVQSRVEAFKSSPVPTTQLPTRARPESISVTARIIRDPGQPFPAMSEAGKNPEDYAPLDLKQSPLVIDHQKAVEVPKETIQERRLSKERRLSNASRTTTTTTKERRSSITIIKDFVSDTRTSISERRRSINLDRDLSSPSLKSPFMKSPSRPPSVHQSPRMNLTNRLSSSKPDLTNSLSPPPTSSSSSSLSDDKGEKKANRASRMLRRMSSSLSSSRKNIAHAVSPTVREDPEPANEYATSSASLTPTPTSTNIGDVNVQFPDTLLWKRRSMLLDSQGYLIMSPALSASGNPKDKSNAGATKRFHLSDFRTPTIPDVEMQELPNSVILDFVEGGQLQVACEDRAGQGHVLKGGSSPIPDYTSLC
ncbi:hypothetical protein L207DRAFT_523594 [Hyaloscypha variabilis F]|uniref:ADF-H domain-containing protein n=1 Tax=Hyaloscypha variabilis (strain UAMH 11265 / GT02V1 / F) TaxID=1149755 RepID=A0A2J6S5X8_HYAVF|nr:hypothetical protein L207DRAFT_523594 [Hyaloscypha variabilis F]